jgi:hypothetical protein
MNSSFAKVDSHLQHGPSLTHAQPSQKRLCHLQMHISFAAALPYASSSIHNVSRGVLYIKTQHFMLTCYSLADILKYDKPTILRNKQTADNDNSAQDDRPRSSDVENATNF